MQSHGCLGEAAQGQVRNDHAHRVHKKSNGLGFRTIKGDIDAPTIQVAKIWHFPRSSFRVGLEGGGWSQLGGETDAAGSFPRACQGQGLTEGQAVALRDLLIARLRRTNVLFLCGGDPQVNVSLEGRVYGGIIAVTVIIPARQHTKPIHTAASEFAFHAQAT